MKKLLLLFAVLAFGVSVQAQTRHILIEHFTGENCGPCAADNPGFENLLNSASNAPKVTHITFMEPVPTSGYFYDSSQNMNFFRMVNYYNPLYHGYLTTPSCVIDGAFFDTVNKGFIAYFTQSNIDNEYAIPSPFNITAYHTFNQAHDSVFVHVHVTCVTNYTSTALKLRTAWVKNMNFTTAPGSNGEKDFENVVRDMFPSTGNPKSGNSYGNAYTGMASSWTAGQTQDYLVSGKIKGLDKFAGFTSNDSFAVVWIQNDINTSVQQSAVSRDATSVPSITNSLQDIQIFPNPAHNSINISGTLNTPTATKISIINTIGQTVLVKEFNTGNNSINENISLDNIASGIYFVSFTNNGQTITKKLTVNK